MRLGFLRKAKPPMISTSWAHISDVPKPIYCQIAFNHHSDSNLYRVYECQSVLSALPSDLFISGRQDITLTPQINPFAPMDSGRLGTELFTPEEALRSLYHFDYGYTEDAIQDLKRYHNLPVADDELSQARKRKTNIPDDSTLLNFRDERVPVRQIKLFTMSMKTNIDYFIHPSDMRFFADFLYPNHVRPIGPAEVIQPRETVMAFLEKIVSNSQQHRPTPAASSQLTPTTSPQLTPRP